MSLARFFAPTSRSSLSVYLALRLLQMGACSIAGFIFCYLIWQHNNHYCAYSNCPSWQMDQTVVPTVYIWLVTTIVAGIISAFVLSYRQLGFFVERISTTDPVTGFPTRPVQLPVSRPDISTNVDADSEDGPPMPITIWLRQLPSSIPQTALVIDVSLLTVFFFSWCEYSNKMILGPVIPTCWLWGSVGPDSHAYWANLSVISKECILSQCSWTTCYIAMALMLLIIVLEAFYVRKEYEERRDAGKADDALDVVVVVSEKAETTREN